MDEINVILPEELEKLKIAPGHDYMTLLTCTPYMINSHRLLVRGHRVPYDAAVMEKQVTENRSSNIYRILFFITLFILLSLILWLLNKRRRRKREERKIKNLRNRKLREKRKQLLEETLPFETAENENDEKK